VSIPLRDQFATWLGWLLPADVPLGFVLAAGQDGAEVAWQAAKIGYEYLTGQLAGGMARVKGSPPASPARAARMTPPQPLLLLTGPLTVPGCPACRALRHVVPGARP
jgi:hypothetical protein